MTKRYDRKAAAEYLAETFGIRLAHRTFEALPVPYVVVLGRALYTAADLDAFATAQLQKAPRRIRCATQAGLSNHQRAKSEEAAATAAWRSRLAQTA